MRIKVILFSLAGGVLVISLAFAQIVLGSEKFISPLPDEAHTLAYDVPSTLSPTLTPTTTPSPIPTNTPTPTPSPSPTILGTCDQNCKVPNEVRVLTPSPSPTPAPVLITGPELEDLFSRISGEFGVDKEQLKRIAACESGFNTNATNGPYGGMYQFSEGSWTSARSAMGADSNPGLRFHPEEAIKTAAYKVKNGQVGAWPNCQ